MARQWFPRMMLVVLGLCLWPLVQAVAATADLYWLGGTSSTGAPLFIPVTATNPLPTACH